MGLGESPGPGAPEAPAGAPTQFLRVGLLKISRIMRDPVTATVTIHQCRRFAQKTT